MPVCKRHVLCLYERALQMPVNVVEPMVAIRSVVYDRPAEIRMVQASIAAQRIARGDRLFVAYHENTPVGHLFAAIRECQVEEIDDMLYVEEKEVYLYAAHTGSEFRGKHIYPHLITRASEYFKRESYEYAMIFSTEENARSRRGIERSGFSLYEEIDYRNLLGWRSWRIRIGDRHVRSRLRIES